MQGLSAFFVGFRSGVSWLAEGFCGEAFSMTVGTVPANR